MRAKNDKQIGQIRPIPISKIKVNPENPRVIRDDRFKSLVQSIKDFPEMLEKRPIVVNKQMIVLGGNMRLRACMEAGLKEVPVLVADWSEAKQKEFIIKDNTSGGEWDWEMLGNEWNPEELNKWGLDLGLTEIEEGDFDDKGVAPKNQFGVIVTCTDEANQKSTYDQLLEQGYECKIVVT